MRLELTLKLSILIVISIVSCSKLCQDFVESKKAEKVLIEELQSRIETFSKDLRYIN